MFNAKHSLFLTKKIVLVILFILLFSLSLSATQISVLSEVFSTSSG